MDTKDYSEAEARGASQSSFVPPVGKVLFAALALLIASLTCSCARTQAVRPPEPGPAAAADAADPLAVLIAGLESDDPIVQADAARLLGELRLREAVGPLLNYVCTDPHYSKTAGLEALARIGDPSVCPRIRQLITDPHVPDDTPWYGCQSVKIAAALTLLSLGDESGAATVQQIVEAKAKDRSPEDAAQWALYTWFAPAVLELPDGLEPARKLKQEMTFERLFPAEKKDPGQIVVIARSLGMLNTEKSLGKLVELLKFHSRYVRASAAVSLLKASPTPEHIAAVTELAEKDPFEFVRIKASLALALAGDDKRVPALVKAAESAENSLDRAAAVEALGLLHQRAYVAVLMRQLWQADPFVRLSAIQALDRMGGGETVALAVAGCRQDESPRVRLYAAKYFAARQGQAQRAVQEDQALKVGVARVRHRAAAAALLTPTGMGHVQPTLGVLDDLYGPRHSLPGRRQSRLCGHRRPALYRPRRASRRQRSGGQTDRLRSIECSDRQHAQPLLLVESGRQFGRSGQKGPGRGEEEGDGRVYRGLPGGLQEPAAGRDGRHHGVAEGTRGRQPPNALCQRRSSAHLGRRLLRGPRREVLRSRVRTAKGLTSSASGNRAGRNRSPF